MLRCVDDADSDEAAITGALSELSATITAHAPLAATDTGADILCEALQQLHAAALDSGHSERYPGAWRQLMRACADGASRERVRGAASERGLAAVEPSAEGAATSSPTPGAAAGSPHAVAANAALAAQPSAHSDDVIILDDCEEEEPTRDEAAAGALGGTMGSQEVVLLGQAGFDVLRDAPHPRPACIERPWASGPQDFCTHCVCWVCERPPAECAHWATGDRHCDAQPDSEVWRQAREAVLGPPSHPEPARTAHERPWLTAAEQRRAAASAPDAAVPLSSEAVQLVAEIANCEVAEARAALLEGGGHVQLALEALFSERSRARALQRQRPREAAAPARPPAGSPSSGWRRRTLRQASSPPPRARQAAPAQAEFEAPPVAEPVAASRGGATPAADEPASGLAQTPAADEPASGPAQTPLWSARGALTVRSLAECACAHCARPMQHTLAGLCSLDDLLIEPGDEDDGGRAGSADGAASEWPLVELAGCKHALHERCARKLADGSMVATRGHASGIMATLDDAVAAQRHEGEASDGAATDAIRHEPGRHGASARAPAGGALNWTVLNARSLVCPVCGIACRGSVPDPSP